MTEDIFIYKPGEYIDVVNTGVSFNEIGYDKDLVEHNGHGSYKARRAIKVTLRVEELQTVGANTLFWPMVCGMGILFCFAIFIIYWLANKQMFLIDVLNDLWWLILPLLICSGGIKSHYKSKKINKQEYILK